MCEERKIEKKSEWSSLESSRISNPMPDRNCAIYVYTHESRAIRYRDASRLHVALFRASFIYSTLVPLVDSLKTTSFAPT